ncbi:hypothetical protein N431DRAFT_93524 [Stipitochalara longipes BDJ]|nr:hypothetical protein N431DRAFT_93524 [Stipitochalara longipes BDJ]
MLPAEFAFDTHMGAKMAGYSPAKRLAVATVFVPLLAIILYQAVSSNWYAGSRLPFVSPTHHPAGSGDKCLSRDRIIRWLQPRPQTGPRLLRGYESSCQIHVFIHLNIRNAPGTLTLFHS